MIWKRIFSAVLLTGLICPVCDAAVFAGNGATGFGGVIGDGTLELTQVGTSTTINGLLTIGAGDFNDAMVLYFDTVAGGFNSTATFDDTADGLRQAVSGFDGTNRSAITFDTGFDADFAIAIDAGFGGLWGLAGTGSHSFESVVSGPFSPADATVSFSFDLSDVGLAAGDSFDFVGTYLNSGNAFRSDEAFGAGIDGLGNVGQAPAAFTSSETFSTVSAVPEPASVGMMFFGGGLMAYRRRRKRSA